VEVQILEVDRNGLSDGIDLSNYTASATLSPTGASGEISGGCSTSGPLPLVAQPGRLDRQHPSTIFVRFLQTSRRFASSPPPAACREGKKAELKIGQEVPIPQTSYTVA